MAVFIDTSAFLAVLDAGDRNFEKARRAWEKLVGSAETLACHNYVLVEASALVQRRLGLAALRVLEEDVLPLVQTIWVDEDVHRAAVGALLAAADRSLSLVDCVSFEVMRRHGIRTAFAFDAHFAERGFGAPV
jgi:predicted nucleic acid-binding protein